MIRTPPVCLAERVNGIVDALNIALTRLCVPSHLGKVERVIIHRVAVDIVRVVVDLLGLVGQELVLVFDACIVNELLR